MKVSILKKKIIHDEFLVEKKNPLSNATRL